MAKQMHEFNVLLLRAFVLREMQDFPFIDKGGKTAHQRREERASAVTADICGKLMDLDADYWSVTFQSLSNLGQVSRALELPGASVNPKLRLLCVFDTATPGRFVIGPLSNNEFVYDLPAMFPPKDKTA